MLNLKSVLIALLLLLLCACGASVERQNQARSHYTLGLSHLQNGSPTLALKELLKAVELDSSDAEIQAGLAQAYQLKKAFTEAESHYLKALKLSEDDPRYLNNLAALYIDMEEWDKAIDYFTQAANNLLFMRTEVALSGIGYAHFRKGDYPAALNFYQEAKTIAPGYAPIRVRIGEVFSAMGQDNVARGEFEKALQMNSNYAEAHYRLGMLLLREKNVAKAIQHFQRVIELSPESDWGQKAAGLLQSMQ